MSAFKRSAVSVGTPDMSPPDVGSSIGPISLHNAIEGLRQHAAGWMRTWAPLQPEEERKLDAAFIDAGDHVIARWRLRARAADGSGTLNMPMVGIYELRDGKLVGAQMFYSDTAAVLRFLENAGRLKRKGGE